MFSFISKQLYQSIKDHDGLCKVKVISRSKKNEIMECMSDGSWKVKLKAVPEHGKANNELISFLSKELNIVSRHITITRGKTSSRKYVKIIL